MNEPTCPSDASHRAGPRVQRNLLPVYAAALLLSAAIMLWRPDRVTRAVNSVAWPAWVETTPNLAYGPYPENRLDVFRPRYRLGTAAPGVLLFHGGAWARGNRDEIREYLCRPFLANGFIVFNTEYRHGIVLGSEDAVRAVTWFSDHAPSFGASRDRLVVGGVSAGGHLALIGTYLSAAHIAAVVDFYGVTDLGAVLHTPFVRAALPRGNTEAVAARFSPVNHVRKEVAIHSIHGTADGVVPADQSPRLTTEVRHAGGQAETLLIPGAQHGFSRVAARIAYNGAFTFLRRRGLL